MKRNLSKKITLSILAGSMLFANSYVLAAEQGENITIDSGNRDSITMDGPTGNQVTVGGSANVGEITGGFSDNGTVTNNTVTINGGKVGFIEAGFSGGAEVSGNKVIISGGTVGYVAGAMTDYSAVKGGNLSNNGIVMTDGNVKELMAAEVDEEGLGSGVLSGNYVEMSGGTAQNVYGADVRQGEAIGNKVTISGDAKVTGSGSDGFEEGGDRVENQGVYGAISGEKGNAEINSNLGALKDNQVIIKDNAQVSNVYGAYSYGDSDVSGNSVTISGNVVVGQVNGVIGDYKNGQVFGGYTAKGTANANKVTIEGTGTNTTQGYGVDEVVGGWSDFGTANGNNVEIKDGNIKVVEAGVTSGGDLADNKVTISGGTVGYVAGAITDYSAVKGGNLSNNGVIMTDGNVKELMAAEVDEEGLGSGVLSGNYVEMSGGTAQNVYGADVRQGEAIGNKVTISGDAKVTGSGSDGFVEYDPEDRVVNEGVYGAISGEKGNDEINKNLGALKNNQVIVADNAQVSNVYGAYSYGDSDVSGNSVTIKGNVTVSVVNDVINDYQGEVIGGYSKDGNVTSNSVTVEGTSTAENSEGIHVVVGGFSDNGKAINNTVTIKDGKIGDVEGAETFGGDLTGNLVTINGGTVGYVVGAITDYSEVKGGNLKNNGIVMTGGIAQELMGAEVDEEGLGSGVLSGNYVEMSGGTTQNVYGADVRQGDAIGNRVTISGDAKVTGSGSNGVYGAISGEEGNAEINKNLGALKDNQVIIKNNAQVSNVYGAYSHGDSEVSGNTVTISGNVIVGNSSVGDVYGGYSEVGNVTNNNVIIDGTVSGVNGEKVDVYAGYSGKGNVSGNKITLLAGANVENANLHGANINSPDVEIASLRVSEGKAGNNELVIGEGKADNSWSGSVNSLQNFSKITFQNVKWVEGSTVLTVKDVANSDLENTVIDADGVNFDASSTVNIGDSMKFIAGGADGSEKIEGVEYKFGSYTVGTMYTGEMTGDSETGSATIETQEVASQNDLLAENRAVAAAFVNQGSDLISDSLDTLSRGDNYGVKTFASVYGNRSKYDVNSDLKINGWSTIVGVGNEKALDKGDLSWGVFYENGSGNYRTFNEFNNEFFRGDGSMVYNGGGVAARYEQNNGVYLEGSVRAGMLKSEMDQALKDGAGNTYGYDSETTYYGAHIGLGKVVAINDNDTLDVYGKFFHTYNEGDSVAIGKDNMYEFDDITSDRFRVGARITKNKDHKFSAYYGLAYEYEFNGEADMKVGKLDAETQDMQGSTYMAEVGFNYQPSTDSPWNFDLNMRGYAGEREGGTFNVQATYTF